jgi:hypothetical protein
MLLPASSGARFRSPRLEPLSLWPITFGLKEMWVLRAKARIIQGLLQYLLSNLRTGRSEPWQMALPRLQLDGADFERDHLLRQEYDAEILVETIL